MKETVTQLPFPPHYDPVNSQNPEYTPGDPFVLQTKAIEWRKEHGLKYVGSDPLRAHLLIIDAQYDFSFQPGALYVGGRSGTGAMDDHARLVEFIYRYLGFITQITCTMDTHLPYQVFHPVAHLRDDGTHPDPMTMISAADYRQGKYRPNPAMASQIGVNPVWLQKQFLYYCEQLEATGKYQLTVWPYHCLLGSAGHRLVGIIEEARLFHSFVRGADNIPEIKGGNPLTEHYSIFKPEVMTLFDGSPIPGAQKNTKLIETLLRSDVVIITGQAKSHCLAWTINDFLTEITNVDPKLAQKVYLLEDCTSAVVVPGVVDYTEEADKAFERFADAGMHLVKSTESIEAWPGMDAKIPVAP